MPRGAGPPTAVVTTHPAAVVMAVRQLVVLAIVAAVACHSPATRPTTMVSPAALPVPSAARQMLLVVTADWDAVPGQLQRYERAPGRPWRPVGDAIPIVVGRTGLAWGVGLTRPDGSPGPIKREGDGRSPAGIFALGTAFGFADSDPAVRLPYRRLTVLTDCVDDPAAPQYNRIVDRDATAPPPWASAERMRGVDPEYRLGIVVEHNTDPPVPGRGSCIFLHIWDGPAHGTSGCTAMTDAAIETLLRWLDPADRPVLVQLPRAAYLARLESWGLPPL